MNQYSYSSRQKISLLFLQIFIGWHFLYEGVIKLYNPSWTAKPYLVSAEGPFQAIFQAMANSPFLIFVDYSNIVILVLVGTMLLLGFQTKLAAFFGAILLLLYYAAHPAFPGLSTYGTEGSYWFVNKNIIECAALFVIFNFPISDHFGLQSLLNIKKNTTTANH